MPDYPPEILQAAAEVMLRQYESQYSAGHLTWRDFATPAREVLDTAAPLLAEAVAARIRAFADRNAPMDGGHVPSARRRAFRVAARVAAGAFTTEAESKQMAAEALAAGQYVACPLPEEQQ